MVFIAQSMQQLKAGKIRTECGIKRRITRKCNFCRNCVWLLKADLDCITGSWTLLKNLPTLKSAMGRIEPAPSCLEDRQAVHWANLSHSLHGQIILLRLSIVWSIWVVIFQTKFSWLLCVHASMWCCFCIYCFFCVCFWDEGNFEL